MKITLLGHHDIASLYAMDRIMRRAPHHQYSVLLSGTLSESDALPDDLLQLAAIDRDLCRRFLHTEGTSQRLNEAAELPAPNSDSGLSQLRSSEPDLIMSIRYRRILEEAAIALPRHGVLNLHSAILPNYRGVMTTFWAMLAGEKEIGSTLHRVVDAGIDTGPVLRISCQPTRPDRSYLANVLSLYDAGCDAMLAAIESIANGDEPQCLEQNQNSGAYFSLPKAADLERFRARGLCLATGNEFEQLDTNFCPIK